jgi:hypothetical protein
MTLIRVLNFTSFLSSIDDKLMYGLSETSTYETFNYEVYQTFLKKWKMNNARRFLLSGEDVELDGFPDR